MAGDFRGELARRARELLQVVVQRTNRVAEAPGNPGRSWHEAMAVSEPTFGRGTARTEKACLSPFGDHQGRDYQAAARAGSADGVCTWDAPAKDRRQRRIVHGLRDNDSAVAGAFWRGLRS